LDFPGSQSLPFVMHSGRSVRQLEAISAPQELKQSSSFHQEDRKEISYIFLAFAPAFVFQNDAIGKPMEQVRTDFAA